MTLLEFLSPHLSNSDFCFTKILLTEIKLEIIIGLKPKELTDSESLVLIQFPKTNEIHLTLKDSDLFGGNSYNLARYTIVNGSVSENTDFPNKTYYKFRNLVKQYVISNS